MAVRSYGNGSGTVSVFLVEARSTTHPFEHCGMILDGEWRLVHFPKSQSQTGVRNLLLYAEAREHGFLNYEAALALAYWFMAEPQSGVPTAEWRIETRIVKVNYKYEYSIEEAGVGPVLTNSDNFHGFKPREDKNERAGY